jgi:hypothetical protein
MERCLIAHAEGVCLLKMVEYCGSVLQPASLLAP